MKTDKLIYILPLSIICLIIFAAIRANITIEKISDPAVINLPAEVKQLLLTNTESELMYFDYHGKTIQYFFISHNESRCNLILQKLKQLAISLRFKIPEGAYLAVLHDAMPGDYYGVPVLAFASDVKLVHSKKAILIPDPFATKGYTETFRKIDVNISKYPWRKKIAKVFFRGSAYGAGPECNDLNGFPRLRFMSYAQQLNFADVGFTDYTNQLNPHFKERVATLFPLKAKISPQDSLAYKYLIDIDGNTCSFARLAWLLYSNSVVMKHASSNVQWYYEQLKPFVHYVPIAADFNDLEQQFAWAQTHPVAAKRIAMNGRLLARRIFSEESILQSYAKALNEYNTQKLGL